MNTEDSFIEKPEFHGFDKNTSFDRSYAFLINDSNQKQTSNKPLEMLSSTFVPMKLNEDNQNLMASQDSASLWSTDKSFQMNPEAFNVLQRPPVLVDVNHGEISPVRKKLVYAPISPVLQTVTPMKITNVSTIEDAVETPLISDDIYNKFSKNRGHWDVQASINKTDTLLNKYCSHVQIYNDESSEDKVDILSKSETPKSTIKTDSSNNEYTPAKSNDDSMGTSKTIIPVKISPPFLSMENSNNAMDNSIKIMEKLNLKSEVCQDFKGPLSFENKISKIKNKVKQKFCDNMKEVDKDYVNSEIENKTNISQCAPASPNLFSDDDSDNMDIDNSIEMTNKPIKADKNDTLHQKDSELLRRLQKTLSGVLPPPSVTITQLDLGQIIDLYKSNLANDQNSLLMTPNKKASSDVILDNQNSSTPPSMNSWVSLPADFGTIDPMQTELQSQDSKETITSSLLPKSSKMKSLLVSCTFEEMINASWPEVMDCRYHGVHYNRSSVSEEFELLCLKFCERYIGAETQTSCTLGLRPQVKKSTVSRFTQSPGRRLSHLARRRQTFSSANLQAGCSLENKVKKPVVSARQIMLSSRNDNTNRRRYRPLPTRKTPSRKTPGKKTPGRKTPGRKTPGKKTPCRKTPRKTPGKQTPTTSARKRNICRRIILDESSSSSSKPTRETSKRALFQSPSESFDIEHSSTSNSRFDNGFPPRRALFHSPEKQDSTSLMEIEANTNISCDTRKRKFSEISDSTSDSSPKSKFPRSLSFNSGTEKNSKILTRRSSENIVGTTNKSLNSELSDIHRKKLLWAVAEALRSHNIGMSHPQFKTHAAVLARLTKKLISEDKQKTGSTSEKMLKLAKLHVFSVIKGKTVEEIIIEEHIRKAKASSSKVTGYVPLSEYEQNKISALNQRLIKPIIKDTKATANTLIHHTNSSFVSNYSSMSSNISPAKSVLQDKSLNLENNILDPKVKARRQICFDDCPKR